MDGEPHRAGLVASGAMHLALLAVLMFGFARAPRFDDAPESIPVETITSTQLNEIMKGEKTGKPAPPAPAQPVPEPPKREPAPPTPPEPPKPEPPKPEPPPPEPPPPEPPKRPEPPPPKPEPPPPEPPKRPEPQPPKRPEPQPPLRQEPPKPVAEDAPSPPVKPRPQKAEETPRPPDRPRPKSDETPKPDKFKPDEIAKALARDKAEEKPKAPAFDPSAINKLIGQTRTAEIKPNAAPQGLPNRNAPRMSVSLENALNEWFRDSYKNCWNLPPSNPVGENYVFDVRVTFNPDGSLAGRPVMLNPPHDPEWRTHAESVMRAVQRCNPLHIPTQYAPYFDQWRSKTIHFDPASAEG